MAAKAGRLDEADAARARRPAPARATTPSRSSPRPCSTSRPTSTRARGELAAAAALVADGLAESTAWSARYSWPLMWLGTRISADAAVRARDRHGERRRSVVEAQVPELAPRRRRRRRRPAAAPTAP